MTLQEVLSVYKKIMKEQEVLFEPFQFFLFMNTFKHLTHSIPKAVLRQVYVCELERIVWQLK